MNHAPQRLEILQAGERTIIGFGDKHFLDSLSLEACRYELDDVIRAQRCTILAVDLRGIVILPSSLLGMLVSLRQRGLTVQLLNPSDEIRAVLQVTRLASRFDLRPVDASSSSPAA